MTPSVFSQAFRTLLSKRSLQTDPQIEAFLYSGLSSLHDPFLMKNMKEVKARIEKAVHSHEKIL
ncbi:MAG: single-stranded-DNA-specific exonuclease RecJ, partial [Candidatus Omnitrophota bacterium]